MILKRPEETRYPTVYEMLNIKHDIIANVLFDQRRVESILLLPDRAAGREVIERNRSQQDAYLMNGDELKGGPSFRAYACHVKNPMFFVHNPEAAIQYDFVLR
jgi:hypothetical protein